MLEEMYEDRKKFKKLMLKAKQDYENEKDKTKLYEIEKKIARYNNLQLAKKVSLNSAYGALGSQYFRFYDLRQALAVTQAGQLSIRWIENKLNEYMNNILKTEGNDYVIASDTDSIYLRLGELVNSVYEKEGRDNQKIIAFMDKVCEAKIQPFIDRAYLDLANYVRAHAQKMIMKREALANKGIWTAKKRYAINVYNNEGVAYKEPTLKVMGLEMVKSSTPSVIRVKMREVLKLMMTGTEEDVYKFIEDFKNNNDNHKDLKNSSIDKIISNSIFESKDEDETNRNSNHQREQNLQWPRRNYVRSYFLNCLFRSNTNCFFIFVYAA
jgi:DNA polymerase elongation subunit (family B)